jgi:polysaccharide export outer membrane protein
MRMSGLLRLAIAGAALIVSGCSSMSDFPPDVVQGPGRAPTNNVEGDYRIGVDDRVQVSVWRNPELTVTAPVRPDGKIAVPIIGDVQVGGHTPTEVAETIKKRLSEYIREPNVAVIVTELRSHEFLSRVRVTGAVRTPRSINHRQGMTVLDAILEAGGVTEFASPNRSRLFRKTQTKTEVFDIELDDILRKGRLETNLLLSPGDVISVPERLF